MLSIELLMFLSIRFKPMQRIGFGGSCYWCTEAIFRSLVGVEKVEQGWIQAKQLGDFAEGVIVAFDESKISLQSLIEIHLHTHSATSEHSLREKYRSAVYILDDHQRLQAHESLALLQGDFEQPLVTQVLDFKDFKLSKSEYQDYYFSDPNKPFCVNVITPKLRALMEKFSDKLKDEVKSLIARQGSSQNNDIEKE